MTREQRVLLHSRIGEFVASLADDFAPISIRHELVRRNFTSGGNHIDEKFVEIRVPYTVENE